MAVELRPVDADKLGDPVDGHTTATAHTRPVDHDSVEANDSGYTEGLGG